MLRIILIILLIYFLFSIFKADSEIIINRREKRLIENIDPNYDKKVGR